MNLITASPERPSEIAMVLLPLRAGLGWPFAGAGPSNVICLLGRAKIVSPFQFLRPVGASEKLGFHPLTPSVIPTAAAICGVASPVARASSPSLLTALRLKFGVAMGRLPKYAQRGQKQPLYSRRGRW